MDAGKQRVAINDERQCLNDAAIWIRLHRGCQFDDCWPRHQAISVKHDHVSIAAAPAGDEVFNIARLTAGVFFSSAVVNPRLWAKSPANAEKRPLLGDPYVWIGGVGEKKPIKVLPKASRLNIFINGLKRGKHPTWRFIIDRHNNSSLFD